MRGFLLLTVVVLLAFYASAAVTQSDCKLGYSSCDTCLEYGCFFCSSVGCSVNTEEQRQRCTNETAGTVYDFCPAQNNGCLPSNSSCSDCRNPSRDCYINQTLGFEDNQFCSYFDGNGFGSEICHVSDDAIRTTISSSLQNAKKYDIQDSMSLKLTRNQLHVINSYDVCGSDPNTQTDHYYPSIIIADFDFTLPFVITDLATRDIPSFSVRHTLGTAPAITSISPNTTAIGFQFMTGCNQTAPVEPVIYVLNYNGMLVIALEARDFQYRMVAHQFQALDDQVVTFNLGLLAASASHLKFSVIPIIGAILIAKNHYGSKTQYVLVKVSKRFSAV